MSFRRRFTNVILGLGSLAVLTAAGSASADTFHVTQLAPGVQSSANSSSVNTFTGFTGTTTFGGSSVTGTYSGTYATPAADIYGGAGGSGQYLAIGQGANATLTLSSSVNYFGLWLSALDPGNLISFYNNSTLLFSFAPSNYTELSGVCSGSYCGNPNSAFLGNNSGQIYSFLNFYDTNGTFNKIVLSEIPLVGVFESDNHTIGNLTSDPAGRALSPVPEPSTLLLGLSGLAGLVGSRQKLMARLRRQA